MLFRQKAMDRSLKRLEGEVSVGPSVPRWLTTFTPGLLLTALILGSLTLQVPKSVPLRGWISASAGVSQVKSDVSMQIAEVFAKEGESVKKGDPIIYLKRNTTTTDGQSDDTIRSILRRKLDILEAEASNLEEQIRLTASIAESDQADVRQQSEHLTDGLEISDEQLQILNFRLARYQKEAQAGSISKEKLEDLTNAVLELRAQTLIKQSELKSLNKTIAQSDESLTLRRGQLTSELRDVEQAILSTEQQLLTGLIESKRLYNAPFNGTVHNMLDQVGHTVSAGEHLFTLLPDNSALEVTLVFPTSQPGQVAEGQEVSLRYDAFPYRIWGTYPGVISEVSDLIYFPGQLKEVDVPLSEPFFFLKARLNHQSIQRRDKVRPLKIGMAVTGNVTTDHRSAFQWVFRSFFEAKR